MSGWKTVQLGDLCFTLPRDSDLSQDGVWHQVHIPDDGVCGIVDLILTTEF